MAQCTVCDATNCMKCAICAEWYCPTHIGAHICEELESSSDGSEFNPDDEPDDEIEPIVQQKKKQRAKKAVAVTQSDSSSEEESDNEEDDEGLDERDGKSEKSIKKSSSSPKDFEAEYYSSDDDETPLDAPRGTARNEFDGTIAVLRRINAMFEAYAKNHVVLKEIKLFQQQQKEKLHRFSADKLYHTIKNRNAIEQQTSGYVFHISRPAQWLALALLLRDPQYRPCDIYVELWPSVLRNLMCIRGGNSLISPYSNMARTWPSLALKLHETAVLLGKAVCARKFKGEAREKVVARVGHQALAAVMLYVYKGRGDEIYWYLEETLDISSQLMDDIEEYTSEFFALSFGVETERLFLTHLETLIHLENIANGYSCPVNPKILCSRGGTSTTMRQRRFNFLNIFSGVREIDGEFKHVYIPAQFETTKLGKERDVTAYKGFQSTPDINSAMRFMDEDKQKKTKLTRGKSMVAGGAGFFHLKPFLGGKNKKGNEYREHTMNEVTEAVWEQVRPLDDEEDRRKAHANRLEFMACIRAYNTIANFLRRNGVRAARGNYDQRFRFYGETQGGLDLMMGRLATLLGLVATPLDNSVLAWQNSFPTLESQLSFDKYLDHLLQTQVIPEPCYQNDKTLDSTHIYRQKGFCFALDFQLALDPLRELWPIKAFKRLRHRGGWLTNDKMHELFLSHLRDFDQFITVLPPVDATQNWWDMTGQILQCMEQQMLQNQVVNPFLICPITFDNRHWVSFVIEFNRNNIAQSTVYFFDSLGSDPRKIAFIRRILQDTQLITQPVFVDLSTEIQDDGHTCGTWMIAAIKLILTLRSEGEELATSADFLKRLLALSSTIEEQHQENLKFQRGENG